MASGGRLYDGPAVLIPAAQLNLPLRIRVACFNWISSCLYFTVPDEPTVIRAQYLPLPGHRANLARHQVGRGAPGAGGSHDPRVRDAVATHLERFRAHHELKWLPSEVVALTSCDEMLFALTLAQGRTKAEDKWVVHRIPIHSDRGFHPDELSAWSELPLTPEYVQEDPFALGFAVLTTNTRSYEVYVSGNGPVRRGKFSPNHKMQLESLDDVFGPTRQPLVLARRSRSGEPSKKMPQERLLIGNPTTGGIFGLNARASKVTSTRLYTLPEEVTFVGQSSLAELSVSTAHLEAQTPDSVEPQVHFEPGNETIVLTAVVSRALAQVWCVSDLGDYERYYPLLGGGTSPTSNGAPPNLLDADIGAVDTICPIHNGGFLVGGRDQPNWCALLLPRMLRAFGILPDDGLHSTFRTAKTARDS
jgi:hypothetical protein